MNRTICVHCQGNSYEGLGYPISEDEAECIFSLVPGDFPNLKHDMLQHEDLCDRYRMRVQLHGVSWFKMRDVVNAFDKRAEQWVQEGRPTPPGCDVRQ